MRYRLCRFKDGEVVLDKECMSPAAFGCNKQWFEKGGTAFIIEYRWKTPEKLEGDHRYYILNPDRKHVVWEPIKPEELMEKYKYFAMLRLAGAL